MKTLCFVVLAVFAACIAEGINPQPSALLGAKQCTWGPSYWCTNLTAASQCHAVQHCIQTVWEHKTLPPDTDSVCQTCLKMVAEARDQLESNETQEEIKEVFEGSCKLIPIKVISKECCKIADDFIPELVDTLASQMNPQVVCSVAGLCNNERVDKLIAEYGNDEASDSCEGCHTVMGILQARFEKMSKDEVLQSMLQVCGRVSSLSDACTNIVVTYFKEIYDHLQSNFNANDVCLLAGECAAQFHTHVEITPLSKVGFVHIATENDDLPCDLCEQLVKHLRDILVANTTELEFKRMLEGICNETREFSTECKSLVDEYYDVIYTYLTTNLNDTIICSAAGLCPSSEADKVAIPIAPILPVDQAAKVLEISAGHTDPKPLNRVGIDEDGSSAIQIMQRPENMQLPIERVFPPHTQETYNNQLCLFCEYFLHYLQQAITDPKTENEIKQIVDKGCEKLPTSVHDTCIAFVNDYGDAVVALLAQEIDPSTVCPLIKLCPSSDATHVEIFFEEKGNDSNCPLCLFAVSTLEGMLTNPKTEAEIKTALDSLCTHFSAHVSQQCQSFVDEYSERLIEMLLADLTAQEVCVYLQLCKDEMPPKPLTVPSEPEDLQILTNEIMDYTSNGEFIVPIKSKPGDNKPQCVICEFAMEKLQNLLENKTTEDEIKHAVLSICTHLPKTVRSECSSFVNQYADVVITLLISSLKPDEICEYIKLCDKKASDRQPKIIDLDGIVDPVGLLEPNAEIVPPKKVKSPQCALCKVVMRQLERVLIGKLTKDEIVTALYKICNDIPKEYENSCDKFMHDHAETIANLILDAVQPDEVCSILFLCSADFQNMKGEVIQCALCEAVYLNYVDLANRKQRVTTKAICKSMTPEYKQPCRDMLKKEFSNLGIYQSLGVDMTSACSELNYCKGVAPSRQRRQSEQILIGGQPCTWGPSYWCESLQNAQSCGDGALQHCRQRQWKADAPSSRKRRQPEQVLIGGQPCTWGPSYWCDSLENAQSCGQGALQHCRERQWKADAPSQ